MKILLFGKNGQVGRELQRALSPLGTLVALGRDEADFINPNSLRSITVQVDPDVIVNAAAYTHVDVAEKDVAAAEKINGQSVAVLAEEAKSRGAVLVHYSTDYVFDGRKSGAYDEGDAPHPLSVYGRTKREGEQAIALSGAKHFIFRTSWVFAPQGKNFLNTMLKLACERDEVQVVDDQHGAPTGAALIADVTALALYRAAADPDAKGGLYHLASAGEVSWFGYACHAIDYARRKGAPVKVAQDRILPTSAAAYPVAAQRPCNSRLDTARLRKEFGIHMPDWRGQVEKAIDEILYERQT